MYPWYGKQLWTNLSFPFLQSCFMGFRASFVEICDNKISKLKKLNNYYIYSRLLLMKSFKSKLRNSTWVHVRIQGFLTEYLQHQNFKIENKYKFKAFFFVKIFQKYRNLWYHNLEIQNLSICYGMLQRPFSFYYFLNL